MAEVARENGLQIYTKLEQIPASITEAKCHKTGAAALLFFISTNFVRNMTTGTGI